MEIVFLGEIGKSSRSARLPLTHATTSPTMSQQTKKVIGLVAVLGGAGLSAIPMVMAYQQGPPERAKNNDRVGGGSIWSQIDNDIKKDKAAKKKAEEASGDAGEVKKKKATW